jgi:branched-chain amino acid transport system ATP-binding protein
MILEAQGVSMHFGGVKAVSELSVSVEEGKIFGIIGPNGSGKTTFFNILTGNYTLTSGKFIFKGDDITGLAPNRVAMNGIARTFQNIRLFRSMSVLENVMVGQHPRIKTSVMDAIFRTRRLNRLESGAREKAIELLHFVGLDEKSDEIASNLAYGEQRRVELARALANQPKLLLLDELTAGMNPVEAASIVSLIREVRDTGITIILIEHNMKVMMGIAELIMAMDAGRRIALGTPDEIRTNEAVIRSYLGEEE